MDIVEVLYDHNMTIEIILGHLHFQIDEMFLVCYIVVQIVCGFELILLLGHLQAHSMLSGPMILAVWRLCLFRHPSPVRDP